MKTKKETKQKEIEDMNIKEVLIMKTKKETKQKEIEDMNILGTLRDFGRALSVRARKLCNNPKLLPILEEIEEGFKKAENYAKKLKPESMDDIEFHCMMNYEAECFMELAKKHGVKPDFEF